LIYIFIIVKYLQAVGHGEQVTLHFIFIQVIVVDFFKVFEFVDTNVRLKAATSRS